MDKHKSGPRPAHRAEWKVVKELRDGKFCVVVSRLDGVRPSYSVQVGTHRESRGFVPHLPLDVEGLHKIALRTSLTKGLAGLLLAAEEWVLEEAALHSDEHIEKLIEKETKDANFGKGQTRVTGKTAKKKARLRQAA